MCTMCMASADSVSMGTAYRVVTVCLAIAQILIISMIVVWVVWDAPMGLSTRVGDVTPAGSPTV